MGQNHRKKFVRVVTDHVSGHRSGLKNVTITPRYSRAESAMEVGNNYNCKCGQLCYGRFIGLGLLSDCICLLGLIYGSSASLFNAAVRDKPPGGVRVVCKIASICFMSVLVTNHTIFVLAKESNRFY